jgi:hypothetical protein
MSPTLLHTRLLARAHLHHDAFRTNLFRHPGLGTILDSLLLRFAPVAAVARRFFYW